MKNKKAFNYGFRFAYRETKGSELKTDCIFFSADKDISNDLLNQCEIRMLSHISKKGFYSGKILRCLVMD